MGSIITPDTSCLVMAIHIVLTYLCTLAQGKPQPLGVTGAFLRDSAAAAALEESSWWTDTDLESTLGHKNTLESISRSWQKHDADALKRVFLKNTNVTCNDGTRSGYYIRRHSGSKIWLIVLEGGWYCYDETSCASRWTHTRTLMSSVSWQPYYQASGIMSGNPEENPIFWRANIVYVPYCSSDVWTGTSPKEQQARSYAFMGALILQEIIKELLPKGLLKARKLMLAGSSAGATGVLLNIDSISDLLLSSGSKVKVRGFIDSGWFLDSAPFTASACIDPRRCSPAATLKKGIILWDSQIPAMCLESFRDDPSSCFYGSKLYSSLRTPVFVFQWLYDEAQLTAGNVFVPRTKAQGAYVQSLRDDMVRSLQNVSAVFAPSCVGHVVLTEKRWIAYSIGQVTLGQALQCWWDGTNEVNNYNSLRIPPRLQNQFDDNNIMLSDEADTGCDPAKMRRCRRRQKVQRKLKRKAGNGRKQCRCRRNKGLRTPTPNSGSAAQITRTKRFSAHIHFQHAWNNHADLCSHHLIDDCRLPNCNSQCPKSYDTFSGMPIDFEQMLRNAGVKSRNPVKDIFS